MQHIQSANTPADLLIKGAKELATTIGASLAPLAGERMSEVSTVSRGFVAARQGKIVAVGSAESLGSVELTPDAQIVDATGKVVVPGLIDPHTHLLFEGGREDEFLMRVAGQSYLDIAKRGGGIARTVAATRKASHQRLFDSGRSRLDMLLRQGTTTVEIKSGYGLSLQGELAMLRVVRDLARSSIPTVVSTFLGAHAVAPEYANRSDEFVEYVAKEMLPAVSQEALAAFCDVFCEEGAFTVEQSRRVLRAASELGLRLKVHGDELTHSGGSRLAAELRATSVDHCNLASRADLNALRSAGTVAVALPGTPFYLLASRYADGRAIVDAGVPLALGTDYSPTSSISSMTLVMSLACLNMKLGAAEILTAATINAAHAIGLAQTVGSLEVGKAADALVLDVEDYRHIPYYGWRPIVDVVVKNGRVVYSKEA